MKSTEICILGAGAFGSAMQKHLEDMGHHPTVWKRGMEIAGCVSGKQYVIFAVPAQAFRQVFAQAAPYLGNATVINLAKGIEQGTLLRLSQVAESICPGCRYVALSGPSHAEEILLGMPTNLCVASTNCAAMKRAQNLLHTDTFRVYTNPDLIGVELGGAVKNVIALATGIADGMGYGDNTRAALMTRGLAEICRLGVAMGANPETFLGLSGVGDLIVTCGSMHSRNRRCGILLGQGVTLDEAQRKIGQVVEGVSSCSAVAALAKKYGVDMPITGFLNRFLTGKIRLEAASKALLARERKAE